MNELRMSNKQRVKEVLVCTTLGLGLVFALSACAEGEAVQNGDTITEKIYRYDGADLHCVYKGSGNHQVMSCDWVRYHAENAGTNG